MNYSEILKAPEYDFLRTHTYLGENIGLLALGGSHAYGTNIPGSDIDVRGMAINPTKQLFNLEKDFEQIVETNTDTTIYSLNKMAKLLLSCNPNTIEILGCKPEHYLYINKYGQLLLDNKEHFLSKKAIDSFGGYANQQYNRLQHALLGNGQNDEMKLEMLLHSLECALTAFNAKHKSTKSSITMKIVDEEEYLEVLKQRFERNKREISNTLAADLTQVFTSESLTDAEKTSKVQSLTDLYRNDLDEITSKHMFNMQDAANAVGDRIVLTGNFEEYPLGEVQALLREFHQIKSEYGNINKRNTKKDVPHMAKHMMHLIRLYMMGTDLNSGKGIRTFRDGKDHELLMSIRNQEYMTGDGMRVIPEFYELLTDVQDNYNYSVKHTVLPESPNYDALNEMMFSIYKEAAFK